MLAFLNDVFQRDTPLASPAGVFYCQATSPGNIDSTFLIEVDSPRNGLV